jgi:hypothetical protein
LAVIERSHRQTFPATANEVLVTEDYQMAALVADEPTVGMAYHRPELDLRNAIRAPNYYLLKAGYLHLLLPV